MAYEDPSKYRKAELLLEGGVSADTGEPFCVVRWANERGQLSPEELRQFGLSAIAVAENAERDAAVVKWLKGVGYSDREAGAFLMQMRETREA